MGTEATKTDSGNQNAQSSGSEGKGDETKTDQGGAGSAGQQGSEGSQGTDRGSQQKSTSQADELDESTLDEKTRKHLKKLRDEAAKYRTKANALESQLGTFKQRVTKLVGGEEDEELTPEQQVGVLETQIMHTQFDNAVLTTALDNGVPGSGLKYFKYLMAQAVEELGEGEELSDEKLKEILAEVKSKSGAGSSATTSVTTPREQAPDTKAELTLDQFVKMSMAEKSVLYGKNPDLYQKLMGEAKEKRRLV